MKEIHRRIPDRHLVRRFQAWLAIIREHGGDIKETCGVPVEEIQEGIRHGVRKINIDIDIRPAMTAATRRARARDKSEFDSRKFLKEATTAGQEHMPGALRGARLRRSAAAIKPVPLEKMAQQYRPRERPA